METTCAVYITNGESVLIVHPTNAPWKYWSLPKGCIENNESFVDCVIRETFEETGLKLNKEKLVFKGLFPYHKNKNYVLFLYITNVMPSLKNLCCRSSFIDKKGNKLLEIDQFKIVNKNQLVNYINPKQFEILRNI